jgi:Ca2+-binding RTX toxin-like protein
LGACYMPDLVTLPTPPSDAPNVTGTISTTGGVTISEGDLRYTTTLPRLFDPSDFDSGATSYVLTNAGTIWDDYAAGAQVMVLMNWGEIDNSGSIVAHSSDGDAQTLEVTSTFRSGLENSGSIYALSDSHVAWALTDWSQQGVIDNSGLIAARGGTAARTVLLANGGVVVNEAGGSILAEGADSIAVYLGRGHFQVEGQLPSATDLTNSGLIEAQSTDPSQASVAVDVAHLESESMVIDNHGTIVGDFSIYSDSYAFSPPQNSAELITNESDGTIQGEIYLDLGDDRLVNKGLITGHIDMGEGNDLVDNGLGTHAGDTELGWGNDTYLGGAGFDAVTGNRGDDSISGGDGNDLLLGGWGDDTIRGDAGNDGLYGEGGNDTITTSGGDYVDAGDGDDRVILGNYSFAQVSGGNGFDVLELPADGRILDLSQALTGGRLSRFEEIALASGGQIVIHQGDVGAMGTPF